MSTWLAWAASLASLATCAGHVFMGGPQVAKPLLESHELPLQAKWMAYFCWHVTTIVVLAMSAGFALVATGLAGGALGALLSVVGAAIWLLSIAVAVIGGLPAHQNPGVWFFGLITLLGVGATWT